MSSALAQHKPLVVIKVGGDVLLDEKEKTGLADNVLSLIQQSWKVVILHGGGQQVSDMQSRLGITPNKIAGRRITSDEDLTVVKQVLCGQVNVDLVSLLQSYGVNAFGCHGASGQLILAEKRPPRKISGAGAAPVDFGRVGDVVAINKSVLHRLIEVDLVPVIASLGIDKKGCIFNINADTTVVQIARHLCADLLIFTTGIGAIFEDINNPQTRIAQLNPESARHLIRNGVIADGMIPKVEEALSLLQSGVGAIAIASACQSGAFVSIAQGETRYGTRIQSNP